MFISRLPAPEKGTVAFFHPSAHGGGGGERVLWMAISVLSRVAPAKKICVYCEAGHTSDDLKRQALDLFGITLSAELHVLPLESAHLLAAERWPRFTMVGQALASVRVAWECLGLLVPEVWVDTTGWAFPYLLVFLARSKVACYVHYPTISTNMILRISNQTASFNNTSAIASSFMLSVFKLLYYNLFALLYGFCGMWPAVVMVNSNWTRAHVMTLWWRWGCRKPVVVYPPCDTTALQSLPLDRPLKSLYIVSLAQFRPEKNHRLQLEAFAQAKNLMRKHSLGTPSARAAQLRLIGGCRNEADAARMSALQDLAEGLGIADCVEFYPNANISEVTRMLRGAVAGIHSMVDEHFGIGIVEYMAAGALPIAHNSGGPKEDIVIPAVGEFTGGRSPVGFRVTTVQEYAKAIVDVLVMPEEERMTIAAAARLRSSQFSQERFAVEFARAMQPLLS